MRLTCKAIICALGVSVAAVSYGCSVRGVANSVPSRIFREVHGLRTRSYKISPVTEDLRAYRRVEVRPLENLMLDQIPETVVTQLNTEILNRTRALNRFERVTHVEAPNPSESAVNQSASEVATAGAPQELIVEGYIDDYTPGIPALRYIEQGNNHAVLTLRITLRDKQTGRTLGETNITVENTRVTSNVPRMVVKAADEVAHFVGSTTSHDNGPKEALAYGK
ncbi:MAG TPA: hypothetical protein VKM94_03265 [Blastocatellia bacterium]|nr:hypothetical protein [Blastocatellia bacterium]